MGERDGSEGGQEKETKNKEHKRIRRLCKLDREQKSGNTKTRKLKENTTRK